MSDHGATREKRFHVLAWMVAALLAAFGCWRLLGAWGEGVSSGHDFVQDYAAILKISDGRNPYEPYNDVTQQLFGGPPHRGKLYSFHAPSSLPFFLWLLAFHWAAGYAGAFLAWGVASLAGLWAICALTLRHLGTEYVGAGRLGARRAWAAGALAALALVALPPIRENFEEGQLNVLVMAGVIGCWATLRSGRTVLAGALLGAAFALKPIPGLFFLYFLWRREWRLLVASGATLAVLGIWGVRLSGIDGAWTWATVNYPDHAAVWPGYPDNASLRGFFTRIFGPSEWRPRPPYDVPGAAMGLTLVSGAILAALGWLAARRPRRLPPHLDLEFALVCLFTLLVTPIVWPHYYVVLVMPLALVTTTLVHLLLGSAQPSPPTMLVRPMLVRRTVERWKVMGALAVLLGATSLLATAQYVEPFGRVGGQQLTALLAVYAVSLLTLRWARRASYVVPVSERESVADAHGARATASMH